MSDNNINKSETPNGHDPDFWAFRKVLIVALDMRTDKDFDSEEWRNRRDLKGTALIKAHVQERMAKNIHDLQTDCQSWKETAEVKQAAIVERDKRIADLQTALAFAASIIKAGKPWTDECEKVIGAAL
jgi:hypothetical protein